MGMMNRIFGLGSKSAVGSLLDQIGVEKNYDSRKKLEASILSLVSPSDSELLRDALADQKRSSDARKVAAMALGKLKDSAAHEVLKTALVDDTETDVRGAAAEALGAIGGGDSVDALLDRYERDSNIASQIADALGEAGDDRAIEPLFAHLRRADDLLERLSIIGSIEKIGGDRAIQGLRQIVTAGRGDTTEELAIKALDRIDPNWKDSSERQSSATVQRDAESQAIEHKERTAEWRDLWPSVPAIASGSPTTQVPLMPQLKSAVASLSVSSANEIRDAIAKNVPDNWPKHWLFRMRRCQGSTEEILRFVDSLLLRYREQGNFQSTNCKANEYRSWFPVDHLFVGIVTNWPIVPMLLLRPSSSELCCMYFEPGD
jgi:hypothetical protein